MPYYTILYYTILYYTILYYTILYYTLLYYTIPYYRTPYYIKAYYNMPYCAVPYSLFIYIYIYVYVSIYANIHTYVYIHTYISALFFYAFVGLLGPHLGQQHEARVAQVLQAHSSSLDLGAGLTERHRSNENLGASRDPLKEIHRD